MFIVIYAKIVDGKKKGISIQGPYQGPECETLSKAHKEARRITSECRDMVLVKIYPLNEYTYEQAKKTANICFSNIFANIIAAESILERPSSRSRRKKRL